MCLTWPFHTSQTNRKQTSIKISTSRRTVFSIIHIEIQHCVRTQCHNRVPLTNNSQSNSEMAKKSETFFTAIKTFRPKSYVHTIERWAYGFVIMLCALPILSCFSFDSYIGRWNENKTIDLIEFGCIKFDPSTRNGNRFCTSHANKKK